VARSEQKKGAQALRGKKPVYLKTGVPSSLAGSGVAVMGLNKKKKQTGWNHLSPKKEKKKRGEGSQRRPRSTENRGHRRVISPEEKEKAAHIPHAKPIWRVSSDGGNYPHKKLDQAEGRGGNLLHQSRRHSGEAGGEKKKWG